HPHDQRHRPQDRATSPLHGHTEHPDPLPKQQTSTYPTKQDGIAPFRPTLKQVGGICRCRWIGWHHIITHPVLSVMPGNSTGCDCRALRTGPDRNENTGWVWLRARPRVRRGPRRRRRARKRATVPTPAKQNRPHRHTNPPTEVSSPAACACSATPSAPNRGSSAWRSSAPWCTPQSTSARPPCSATSPTRPSCPLSPKAPPPPPHSCPPPPCSWPWDWARRPA